MPKLLQIGAGNIGRGFIARIFAQNGYKICFADVNDNVINAINEHKKYQINVVGQKIETEIIENIEGINITKQTEFNQHFLSSDIVTTSVGPNILSIIAKNIVNAVQEKFVNNDLKIITIIACENYVQASTYLRKMVEQLLDPKIKKFHDKYICYVDAAVDCIVPIIKHDNILDVTVEDFHELILAKDQIINDKLKNLKMIQYKSNIQAYIERKLLILNAGHSAIAYLGNLCEYKTITEALSDQLVYKFTVNLMEENAKVISVAHNLDAIEQIEYVQKIIQRFKNPHIIDYLDRVGRDKLRKLNSNERLILPIQHAIKLNIASDIQEMLVAITVISNIENDFDSQILNKLINLKGEKATLAYLTSLNDSKLHNISQIIKSINTKGIKWIQTKL